MPAWTVTVIDRKDKTKAPQEMRVDEPALTTPKKVQAFANAKWKHLRFVKAEPVAADPEQK